MKLKNFTPNDTSNIIEELKKLTVLTKLEFPESVKNFYLENNGGVFKAYQIKNLKEKWILYPLYDTYIGFSEFYPINEILQMYNFFRKEAEIYLDITDEDYFLNTMLPLSVDIFICCKGENIGKIYLVDGVFSCYKEVLPLPQQLIANSFEELLEIMVLEEDDEEYQKLLKS